jgi:hypothetical protein
MHMKRSPPPCGAPERGHPQERGVRFCGASAFGGEPSPEPPGGSGRPRSARGPNPGSAFPGWEIQTLGLIHWWAAGSGPRPSASAAFPGRANPIGCADGTRRDPQLADERAAFPRGGGGLANPGDASAPCGVCRCQAIRTGGPDPSSVVGRRPGPEARPFLRRFPAAICSPVKHPWGWWARAGCGRKALAEFLPVRPPSTRPALRGVDPDRSATLGEGSALRPLLGPEALRRGLRRGEGYWR